MIKNISSLFIACLALLAMTSCLGSDDDETIYYDDTAITSFSLGTMNVKHNIKAKDGVTDSTYTTTLTGSTYRFSIDQLTKTIYNADSLPVGTDASHVLATISSKNSGTIVLNLRNRNGEDSLAYYNSTDSIDFTKPVRIRVYNMRATAFRDYTVKVNIHQQDGDSFAWNTTTGDMASMGQRKIVALGNEVFAFGLTQDGQTVGFKKNGNNWQRLSTSLGSNAYKNMTAWGNYIYTLNGNDLYRSADGETWSLVASNPDIQQIAGASTTRLYALTTNGIVYSTDGSTWTSDRLDDNAGLLPTEEVNFICTSSSMDNNVNNLVIIGNRDGKTMIWRKVEENDNASSAEPWAYYTDDEYNRKTLPYLQNLQVVKNGDELLATGGDLTKFYVSPDMGLTWTVTLTYNLPTAMTGTIIPSAMASDSSNMLYFSTANTGNVLVGRLAKLGWKDSQDVFTK